ncbi:MAG: DUF4175 family protein [Henriciella sp.]
MAKLDDLKGARSLIASTRRRLRDIALWRAWWPLIVLVSVFLIAALLGLFERAPAQMAALATLIVFTGLIITFLRGMRRYSKPTEAEAISALDAQDELRPIASLLDRPAKPEAEGVTLWNAHRTRLSDAMRRLKIPRFAKTWKRLDPAYLRLILPVALLSLVIANNTQTHERLASALTPDYGSLFGAENVRIEAWITPPSYSGRAPIFLKDGQTEVRVPEGSIMTLRVQAPSTPKLRVRSEDGRNTQRFGATPDGAYEATLTIMGDSAVSVLWWGERQTWSVLASPDDAPTAQFVSVPSMGSNDRTDYSWFVSDDYGVSSLEFSIKPVDTDREPDLVRVDLGAVSPKEAEDEVSVDMTRNRWAGARVEVRLVATDGAGQKGHSEPHTFVLPEKLLLQPLAKAVQDIRVTVLREDTDYLVADYTPDSITADAYYVSATQRLNAAPEGVQRGAVMLEAVTYEAPRYFKDILLYSGLTTARYTLEASSSTNEAKETEPLLWAMALRAEYGSSADAYAALMAAKKALEDALRDGASEQEIKRLMEAFKDAAQRYVAAKMAEALANGLESAPDNRDGSEGPAGPDLGGDSFSDMLDALEDLTETGASDQARQLLADITNMLENLEFQEGSGSGDGFPGLPGEPGEGEESEDVPEEERELSETMQELSDLLREQRELNDETLAQQRGERGDPSDQFGEGQPQPGQPGGGELPDWMQEDGADGRSLAERQLELAERLEELAEGDGESAAGGEEGEGEGGGGLLDEDTLEAIERSQRRAGSALDDGNETRAIRNQQQATRQLRELAEGLAENLDEARAARLGENPQGSGGDQTDPFGNATNGAVDDSDSVDIPDAGERQRAKDILDELRKRYGETPDEEEREYLERLLDRF